MKIDMRNKPLLTWIALCTVGALATNGLLTVHLWDCCDHAGDSSPSDHSNSHDSQHCQICQILLVHSGKYIADSSTPMEWTEAFENRPTLPGEQIYAQTHRTARIPRGPPA